ncbi:MAG: carbohydrate kinase family protein [Promethearchaeota archaeon]
MNRLEKSTALVLGSLAFDHVMSSLENYYESLSIDHESKIVQGTFTSVRKVVHFGGTAGNIAYNMAQLGGRPIVVATVGPDFKNMKYEKHLKSSGVDIRVNYIDDESTACCYIFNDNSNNQITVFHSGALNAASRINLKEVLTEDDGVDISINAPNNIDAMLRFSRDLKDLSIREIFDPGQVSGILKREQLEEILDNAFAFISNEHEIQLIEKRFGINVLDYRDELDWIIMTRGAEGSIIYQKDKTTKLPIARADVVKDPTGAGDAFRGGLLYGLTRGLNVIEAARIGAVMGSIAIETIGPQTWKFNPEKFRQRYTTNFGKLPAIFAK